MRQAKKVSFISPTPFIFSSVRDGSENHVPRRDDNAIFTDAADSNDDNEGDQPLARVLTRREALRHKIEGGRVWLLK